MGAGDGMRASTCRLGRYSWLRWRWVGVCVCKKRSNSRTRAGGAQRAVVGVASIAVTTTALASWMPLRRHSVVVVAVLAASLRSFVRANPTESSVWWSQNTHARTVTMLTDILPHLEELSRSETRGPKSAPPIVA